MPNAFSADRDRARCLFAPEINVLSVKHKVQFPAHLISQIQFIQVTLAFWELEP